MIHNGKNKKVGKSSKQKMYGPKKLLVCGYTETHQLELLSLLEDHKLTSIPILFVKSTDSQRILSELLAEEDKYGHGEASEMSRAVVASGLTQKELHLLMTAYRKAKLPTQLWAALTPTSEKWSIAALLEELAAERDEIARLNKKRTP